MEEEYIQKVNHKELNELIKVCYKTKPNPHPLMVHGHPGIGKSLGENERIICIEDGRCKIIPIKDFKVGSKVIGLDDCEIVITKGYGLQKFKHKANILKVKTKSGRTVNATPDHSFLVFNDDSGKFVEKKGRELKEDDIVPTFRTNNLPIFYKKIKIMETRKTPKWFMIKTGEKIIGLKKELKFDFDFGFIIGAYLAEGCLIKNMINFSNQDGVFQDRLINALEKCGFNKPYKPRMNKKGVFLTNKKLNIFLKENCKRYAGYKELNPNFLFTHESFKKGILSGYFTGDGEIQNYVGWTTKSEKLRMGISLLLNSIGVGTSHYEKINKKYGKYYSGYVFDRNLFHKKIPIFRKNYKKKLKQEHSMYETMIFPKNKISEISKDLHLYIRKHEKTRKKIKWFKDKMYRKRVMTREGATNFLNWLKEKGLKYNDEQELKKYIDCRIIFDKIKSIKNIDYNGYVYDIETETHNFLTATGIFVHNSQVVRETAIEIAKSLNLKFTENGEENETTFGFVDRRIGQSSDPSDIRGFPQIVEENGVKKTKWILQEWFPRHPKSRGIILLDEFGDAPPSIQNASKEMILDRKLGGDRLPDGWQIILATNMEDDKTHGFDLAFPLINRMSHVLLDIPLISSKDKNTPTWTDWAIKNKIDYDIVGFINLYKDMLYKMDTKSKAKAFPTPRSNVMLSNLKKRAKTLKETEMCAGMSVGREYALKFISYLELKKELDINNIFKNPEQVKNIKRIDLRYSMITAVNEHYKENNELLKPVLQIIEQMEPEFAILLTKFCKGVNTKFRNEALEFDKKNPKDKIWARVSNKYGQYLW